MSLRRRTVLLRCFALYPYRLRGCNSSRSRPRAEGIPSAREWVILLEKPWEEVRSILLDESDEGQRLRQTDPFCGILTAVERWEIYREHRRA